MGIVYFIWSWLSLSPISATQQQLTNKDISHVMATQKTTRQPKTGIASFYHPMFEGRKTATGEIFDNDKFTAASNHYKLGTYLKVTNVSNGKVVYVKVNDRMGHPTRIIDLAKVAAGELNFVGRGTARVVLEKVSSAEGKKQILAQNAQENSVAAQTPNEL